jgi:CRP-like cAMP-binding protein
MTEELDNTRRLVALSVRRPAGNPAPWNDSREDYAVCPQPSGLEEGSRGRMVSPGRAAGRLTPEERGILATLLVQQRSYAGNASLVSRGQPSIRAFILHRGWACAHRSLPSGARQILSVYVPGDLIGYPAAQACPSEAVLHGHNVSTITDIEVSEIGIDRLSGALALAPGLARAMLWDHARANAMLEERLISLGRRSARERTAHFFLELSVRLGNGSPGHLDSYECPLSQYVIADALGLSAEHLNRILKQLRLARLLHVRSGSVEILDRDGLVRLADFDSGYLSQQTAAVA